MARTMNMAVLVVFGVLAAALLQGTEATNYTVGDTTAWKVPGSTDFYATWASGKTFVVGDILVFNFATGAHDVARVTQAAYTACTIANPENLTSTGPATINLTTAGAHYYICTIGNHCNSGQKLAITVTTGNSSSPTPTGSVTPPPPPPPPSPSSASSVVATFSVIFMSIVLGLLC